MDITMPQLGETVTEGTVTKWLKAIGDQVAADDLLFEVSTDKVDSEVPSPSGGYLFEILVPEGETVPVGTRLAVLSDSPPGGGAAPAAEAPAVEASAVEAQAVEAQAAQAPEGASAAVGAGPAPTAASPPSPASGPVAASGPVSAPAPVPASPSSPAPASPPAPGPDRAPQPALPADGNGSGGMLLSPVVRRLVSEYGLDPSTIKGTGEGGRVTRNDVLGHIDRQKAGGPAAAAASGRAPAPTAARAPAPAGATRGADVTIPFDNMRTRTAEHMVRSKHTSPHVLTAVEVDFEAVQRVRDAHQAQWHDQEGFSLTYLPFVARAVCDALGEFPHINASVGEGELTVHGAVNLGIAVDVDRKGLIVPVIHGADGKRLRALAREVRDLATRARSKKLTPDDVTGGTFTITNPGPYGTFISAPIINQPQVGILSTDGIRKRPVVVESPGGDAIAIHHVGLLAMSWDHRAIDGAYASNFLGRLREIIETRDWEAEVG